MSAITFTALFVLVTQCVFAQSRTVAITIDDLPVAGKANRFEIETINSALLKALQKHKAPATVFVNEQGIKALGAEAGMRLLNSWVEQGHDLGNHTYSHADLSKITSGQFQTEVTKGEETIRKVLAAKKRTPQYLRFPYNHTGDTVEKRNAAAAFLAQRGYKIATCTIDNSDYEFARSYQLMLAKNDIAAATQLRQEYLAFTAAEIDYYSNLHQTVWGRQIPHVMLLHANKLNAEVLDAMLTVFQQKGFRFVTLSQAQEDQAYSFPINAVTSYGPMWGYRWAKEKGIKVNGALEPDPPKWILKYDGEKYRKP